MTKIVHVIDEMKMGGAQTHLLTIIKEMKRQHPEDVHVLVVLFDDTEFKKELIDLNITPILLNLRPFFEKKQFYKAYAEIKKLLKKLNPNVVETHLTWSRLLVNTAAFQLKIARRIGFEHGDIYMNSIKMRLANYGTQFFFHKIIVCSDTLKKWVIKTHSIKEKKLKVLYNCVDLQKFTPTNEKDLKACLELDSLPRYTFVSVGTMGKGVNKRMDISIKAVAKLQKQNIDAGLVLCGDGEQRAELEQLSRKEGVEKQIYFLGNREDVDKILPHCYAYVHSAAYEPFGIVCIEAMASGLPVILPDSGGIQYIIEDKKEGRIYKSLDAEDMAAKMLELINSTTAYTNYKNAAIKKVEQYGVKAYVDKLYQLYV